MEGGSECVRGVTGQDAGHSAGRAGARGRIGARAARSGPTRGAGGAGGGRAVSDARAGRQMRALELAAGDAWRGGVGREGRPGGAGGRAGQGEGSRGTGTAALQQGRRGWAFGSGSGVGHSRAVGSSSRAVATASEKWEGAQLAQLSQAAHRLGNACCTAYATGHRVAQSMDAVIQHPARTHPKRGGSTLICRRANHP